MYYVESFEITLDTSLEYKINHYAAENPHRHLISVMFISIAHYKTVWETKVEDRRGYA
jgi:hypothetical protein